MGMRRPFWARGRCPGRPACSGVLLWRPVFGCVWVSRPALYGHRASPVSTDCVYASNDVIVQGLRTLGKSTSLSMILFRMQSKARIEASHTSGAWYAVFCGMVCVCVRACLCGAVSYAVRIRGDILKYPAINALTTGTVGCMNGTSVQFSRWTITPEWLWQIWMLKTPLSIGHLGCPVPMCTSEEQSRCSISHCFTQDGIVNVIRRLWSGYPIS